MRPALQVGRQPGDRAHCPALCRGTPPTHRLRILSGTCTAGWGEAFPPAQPCSLHQQCHMPPPSCS